jgi:membrane associated rhomboid family serine protease
MIFPLGDDNPTRHAPLVTWALIAANAVVFGMFNLQMAEPELNAWVLRWGFSVDDPFAKQLFTSMFMHSGWAHLLGNMWVLWIVGNNVEDKLGRIRYLLLYLAGGAAAALAFTAIAHVTEVDPMTAKAVARLHTEFPWWEGEHVPLVGASGAIAAIMGTYLVFFPEARIRILFWWFVLVQIVPVRAKWFIGLTLCADLVTSVMAKGAAAGGVATMAHVGGGLFGLVLGLVLKPMVGGGAQGDAWDVHTGFSRTQTPGTEPFRDPRARPYERIAPGEIDEAALVGAERAITQLVRAGRVREAIDVYPAYVAMAREQPLPDDVQIEIAHEFYRQWLPKEAIPAYLRYLETHPRGGDAAEAKFRLGVLYGRGLSRRDEAVRWLRDAASEHGDPKIRDTAKQLLAQLGA